MSNKSTQAVFEQRVQLVHDLLLDGQSRSAILNHIEVSGWKVSTRQVDNYIAEARQWIDQAGTQERARSYAHALARRERLYNQAVAATDFKTALAIDRDRCELLNLYPAKRTELTGKDGGPLETHTTLTMTDADRHNAFHALMARMGTTGGGPSANGHSDGH